MPLLETKGAGSAQGFGLSLGSAERVYIEDVFSTWLIKPTTVNTTYSVTNGIDVSGEGGMVWMKSRDAAGNNLLYDTARGASAGANNALISNSTAAQQTANFDYITGLSNGFTVNFASGGGQLTNDGINYASWTFRKQPKFFDVVTYTGTGTDPLTLNHNLQSVPGVIIIKCTSAASNWRVHSAAVNASLVLNLTNAGFSPDGLIKNLTSTTFQVNNSADVNSSGATYVAYLFAHNAGGFGLTGTDNVISCGTFTAGASGFGPVTLGYEPQWILFKKTNDAQNWYIWDTMRGMALTSSVSLSPNLSDAELNWGASSYVFPTATGFAGTQDFFGNGATVIYIAIRRGPMKVPTSGTQVFEPVFASGTAPTYVTNFVTDMAINRAPSSPSNNDIASRLTGTGNMATESTSQEFADTANIWSYMNGWRTGSRPSYISWNFRRAPGFFDVVCLNSTTSAAQVLSHNLGVAPELIISKGRNVTVPWQTMDATNYLRLNTDQADIGVPQYHTFTSTTFSINSGACSSGENWVFYLFATLAGVSKYGTYTGTGTTQVINCGFTAGSRFVMIKRTDSTGDWYVWDSARGIVAGNDPYLLLNSTAAEVTNTDYIDTASTGFEISSTAPAAINANGGTFIFLAIA